MNTKEMKALMKRNMKRVEQAKEKMGEKWLCHPKNQIKRKQNDNNATT